MSAPIFDLYSFFNSSAAYRVRIALGLKKLEWRHIGVNLRAGEQYKPEYLELNPNKLVPVFRDGDTTIAQSIAIIDYLDDIQPQPLLVPRRGEARLRVLEIALTIACDLHPLNNMRIQKYLSGPMGLSDAKKEEWVNHWLTTGFDAVERMLPEKEGWAIGDGPTLADCCIVPQVANALRSSYSMDAYPKIRRVYEHCQNNPAFSAAAPNVQPDYVGH
jgi:maleylacetoacetate isomerase